MLSYESLTQGGVRGIKLMFRIVPRIVPRTVARIIPRTVPRTIPSIVLGLSLLTGIRGLGGRGAAIELLGW